MSSIAEHHASGISDNHMVRRGSTARFRTYVSFVCHIPAFKVFASGLQADLFFAITTVFTIGSCWTQSSFLK